MIKRYDKDMDLLFFPFSHVSRLQRETLLAFFSSFQYTPLVTDFGREPEMAQLETAGRVTPQFAKAEKLAAIETRVNDYLAWVQLHKGNERNLKALLKDNPYFTDDTGVASIRSQLRRGTGSTTDTKKARDPDPLLFLKFAQMADEQNEKIDAELMGLEKSKAALFSELKGELDAEIPDGPAPESRDPGRVMTGERIANWIRYAGREGLLKSDGAGPLLVTTSDAVFDHLASISKGAINALDIDTIKVHEDGCELKPEWQECLLETLEKAMAGEGLTDDKLPESIQDNCGIKGQIRLGLFSGIDLGDQVPLPGRPMVVCLVKLRT